MNCDSTTILRLLSEQGALSAYQLARAIGCTTDRVLGVIHTLWWEVLPQDGPEGFLYALRATLSKRLDKPVEARKEYSNSRIAYPTSYT